MKAGGIGVFMSCYKCEKRYAECHVNCTKYIEETKIRNEKKEKIISEKTKEREITAIEKRRAKRDKWKS